jgi:hypothetical protein
MTPEGVLACTGLAACAIGWAQFKRRPIVSVLAWGAGAWLLLSALVIIGMTS